MVRKLCAALAALALFTPIMAVPVSAHGGSGFSAKWTWWTEGDVTHVAGTVTNHTGARQVNTQVTIFFLSGDAVVDSATGPAMVTNLAPHSTSPFHIDVTDPIPSYDGTTASVTGTTSVVSPAGGLGLHETELVDATATGTVENDSSLAVTDVTVYGALIESATGKIVDTAASAPLNLSANQADTWSITFDPLIPGDEVQVIAMTTSGTFLTSWNNYFNDLGTSAFVEEIAYLADNGITLGCGPNRFCPTNGVTREQMAAFLDRARSFPDATADYFVDDETSFAEASINRLAEAGVTTGCTDATHFCPKGSVSRQQMAAFLDRTWNFPTAATDYFTDDEASFAEANINDVADVGVTLGCGPTTFCPTAIVTREQMAAFIYRAEMWRLSTL